MLIEALVALRRGQPGDASQAADRAAVRSWKTLALR